MPARMMRACQYHFVYVKPSGTMIDIRGLGEIKLRSAVCPNFDQNVVKKFVRRLKRHVALSLIVSTPPTD